MAGIIATLLADTSQFPADASDRGADRHIRDELERLKAQGDPTLASPYLAASAVSTLGSHGSLEGNFTLTINFPKYGVAVTTANIAYNADAAAIQSAIDTAMSGQTVISTYVNGHIDAGTCANIATSSCALTANGASVNKAHMVVTSTDVNLDLAPPPVTATTIGTQNRPAEAFLNAFDIARPVSAPVAQGETATSGDYVRGLNNAGVSVATVGKLFDVCITSEDKSIGAAIASTSPSITTPTIAASMLSVIPPGIAFRVVASDTINTAVTLRSNALLDRGSANATLTELDADLATAIETYNTWNGSPNATVQGYLDTANNASQYATSAISSGDSAMSSGNTSLASANNSFTYQNYTTAITEAGLASDYFGDIQNVASSHWNYDNAADYATTGLEKVDAANTAMGA